MVTLTLEQLPQYESEFEKAVLQTQNLAALEQLRVQHLGAKSPIRQALKGLKALDPATKKHTAQALNALAARMENRLTEHTKNLQAVALQSRIDSEWIDISLPGTGTPQTGSCHPVKTIGYRCMLLLEKLGFSCGDGPEVETDFYNFDALNIPPHHPARDMQDTFWLSPNTVLRTHTTSVQARVLHTRPPVPIRYAVMGRVYRNEAVDATHLAMFHQLDGFWIEPDLGMTHLLGLLAYLARGLFGEAVRFRFKPKYYPYTEPSIGMDIACAVCQGSGCAACHHAGWITVMGAGMIHPRVLEQAGYHPEATPGLAFGWGLSRLAAQQFALPKLRPLYSGDLRYLQAAGSLTP